MAPLPSGSGAHGLIVPSRRTHLLLLGSPALFIEGSYWLLALVQILGGAAAFIWAARRALQSADTPERAATEPSVPSP